MDAIDLHVHSTFSDGTLTPSELISRAKQFHLAAMALTDHDTIEGIPEAVQAASEQNLELVPGVELSTFWDEKEIHIVGLFIDYTDKTFQKELESLRDVRRNRNITMCEKFTQLGIPIDYSDMEKEYADAVITRAHFADYLLKKGYIKSRNEAFDRYIGSNGPCYVPRKKMPCAEAIRLIKNAGGVPILAHPVLYHLGKEPMNKLMDYLCDSGIVGLEAIYSTYTAGEEIQMKKLAGSCHTLYWMKSKSTADNTFLIQKQHRKLLSAYLHLPLFSPVLFFYPLSLIYTLQNIFQSIGNAVPVMVQCHRVCHRKQSIGRIFHSNAAACIFQHINIIVCIAECRNLLWI